MIRNYGKRSSARRKGNFFAQILLLSVAFIAGYGCSAFYDVSRLSAIIHQWLFMPQASQPLKMPGTQQAIQIPKPKLEFYTLLANEQHGLSPEDKALAEASHQALPQVTKASAQPLTAPTPGNKNLALAQSPEAAVKPTLPPAPKNLDSVTQKLPKLHAAQVATLPGPKSNHTASHAHENYVVQIGSFKSFYEAERMKAALVLKGFDVNINIAKQQNMTWYRVAIGPFASRQEAQYMQVAFARKQHIVGMIRKMDG